MHDAPPPAQPPTAQLQVQESQRESEQAYAAARDAQALANQRAADAARAIQDAQQKQLEAQQAEQRAQQAQQEAQVAQQEAIVAGREAAQRAQMAQQRALELQPEAQAELAQQGPMATVSGTVRSVSDDTIVIARPNAPDMQIRIDPQATTAMRAGQTVQVQDVQQGAPVTISYRVQGGQPVAQIVDESGSPPEVGQGPQLPDQNAPPQP